MSLSIIKLLKTNVEKMSVFRLSMIFMKTKGVKRGDNSQVSGVSKRVSYDFDGGGREDRVSGPSVHRAIYNQPRDQPIARSDREQF